MNKTPKARDLLTLSLIVLSVVVVVAEQGPKLKPEWGSVLPDDQALTFARPRLCNRPAPGAADGTWRPDAATIQRLESVLAVELQAALDLSPERDRGGRPRGASDYYRQYAPLMINGKRIIYVNGLHSGTVARNEKVPWQTTASHACDGGQLFFGTEYDTATGRVSKIIFNGGRGASPSGRGGPVPSDLSEQFEKAAVQGSVHSWCAADDGFAVATEKSREPAYYILTRGGRVETLARYKGRPDLTCYTRREAERLNAAIQSSETIEGTLTPQWDSTVVCGFVDDTGAVCWQYSPKDKRFVPVGGWIT